MSGETETETTPIIYTPERIIRNEVFWKNRITVDNAFTERFPYKYTYDKYNGKFNPVRMKLDLENALKLSRSVTAAILFKLAVNEHVSGTVFQPWYEDEFIYDQYIEEKPPSVIRIDNGGVKYKDGNPIKEERSNWRALNLYTYVKKDGKYVIRAPEGKNKAGTIETERVRLITQKQFNDDDINSPWNYTRRINWTPNKNEMFKDDLGDKEILPRSEMKTRNKDRIKEKMEKRIKELKEKIKRGRDNARQNRDTLDKIKQDGETHEGSITLNENQIRQRARWIFSEYVRLFYRLTAQYQNYDFTCRNENFIYDLGYPLLKCDLENWDVGLKHPDGKAPSRWAPNSNSAMWDASMGSAWEEDEESQHGEGRIIFDKVSREQRANSIYWISTIDTMFILNELIDPCLDFKQKRYEEIERVFQSMFKMKIKKLLENIMDDTGDLKTIHIARFERILTEKPGFKDVCNKLIEYLDREELQELTVRDLFLNIPETYQYSQILLDVKTKLHNACIYTDDLLRLRHYITNFSDLERNGEPDFKTLIANISSRFKESDDISEDVEEIDFAKTQVNEYYKQAMRDVNKRPFYYKFESPTTQHNLAVLGFMNTVMDLDIVYSSIPQDIILEQLRNVYDIELRNSIAFRERLMLSSSLLFTCIINGKDRLEVVLKDANTKLEDFKPKYNNLLIKANKPPITDDDLENIKDDEANEETEEDNNLSLEDDVEIVSLRRKIMQERLYGEIAQILKDNFELDNVINESTVIYNGYKKQQGELAPIRFNGIVIPRVFQKKLLNNYTIDNDTNGNKLSENILPFVSLSIV